MSKCPAVLPAFSSGASQLPKPAGKMTFRQDGSRWICCIKILSFKMAFRSRRQHAFFMLAVEIRCAKYPDISTLQDPWPCIGTTRTSEPGNDSGSSVWLPCTHTSAPYRPQPLAHPATQVVINESKNCLCRVPTHPVPSKSMSTVAGPALSLGRNATFCPD